MLPESARTKRSWRAVTDDMPNSLEISATESQTRCSMNSRICSWRLSAVRVKSASFEPVYAPAGRCPFPSWSGTDQLRAVEDVGFDTIRLLGITGTGENP